MFLLLKLLLDTDNNKRLQVAPFVVGFKYGTSLSIRKISPVTIDILPYYQLVFKSKTIKLHSPVPSSGQAGSGSKNQVTVLTVSALVIRICIFSHGIGDDPDLGIFNIIGQ